MKLPSKERGCKGKIKLEEKRYEKQCNKLSKKHGKRFGVYKCPHCNSYHVTSKLENQDQYKPLLFISNETIPRRIIP